MEPLLLLALAAELTGQSAAQDETLADLFAEVHPQQVLNRHLRDALTSDTAMRPIAEKWLKRMRKGAKSKTLVSRIDGLITVTIGQEPIDPRPSLPAAPTSGQYGSPPF